jgi:hypothetical protein
MKKLFAATALVMATLSASAMEVGVSAVRDSNLNADGVRVTVAAGSIGSIKPILSITHLNNQYNRYAVGSEYVLTKLGPVAVGATAALAYQDNTASVAGYGLALGAKATLPLAKNVDAVLSTERFAGQDRIGNSNGMVTALGLNVKF